MAKYIAVKKADVNRVQHLADLFLTSLRNQELSVDGKLELGIQLADATFRIKES